MERACILIQSILKLNVSSIMFCLFENVLWSQAGMFSVASEDVMKNRAIKKAKRRNVGADVRHLLCPSRHPVLCSKVVLLMSFIVLSQGEIGGAFKAFKGFSVTPTTGMASFSGFGNGAGFKPLSSLTNGSVASVAPSFAGFNVPTSAKTNSGKSFT